MKQTSIEWLAKELELYGDPQYCEIKWNELDELIEQAKEMHKQEIIDAFDEGQEYEYQYHINSAPKFDSEIYYNETYKKD